MPNNVILTPQVFTRMVLMNLGGYLAVCKNMSREYSKEFAKKGAKVGDTVSVFKPQRFTTTKGLGYQPQGLSNIKTTVTVNDVTGVHFEWDTVEKTLSIDDIQKRYAKPAAIALAHDVNARAAQFCAQNTFNMVGTPGATPTLVDTYLSAGDKIVQLGLPPEEDLAMIINRKMSSSFVIGQKTLFNPAGSLGRAFDKGEVDGNPLGYKWHRDQTIYNQTIGAQGGTPQVDGANQVSQQGNNDTMTLNTKGWSNTTTVLGVGDRFTIANVYSVHPQTRQSTGDLQQFVVLAPATTNGSGKVGVLVAPGITPGTAQYANVNVSAADSANITVVGTAGTVSPQALLLHEDAYAFVSIAMEDPEDGKGVERAYQETDPDTGLILSFVRFFDGTNRIHGNRFDMLDGFGVLYRELACVVAG
jgi:P22 coat protein - gene protein 5